MMSVISWNISDVTWKRIRLAKSFVATVNGLVWQTDYPTLSSIA